VLHERLEEANFIEIAANINLKGTGLEDHIKPYHIFQKGDHNVKFFGLINVDHRTKKTTAILNHVQNVEFFCPFETTQKLRKKSRRNAHVLVAITHLGVEEDRMLADLMPELDLIIGGHSHTLIEGVEIRNGVAILQAGKHGDFVDKTTISLSNGKVTSIINKTIDVAKLKAECPIIAEKVRGYMDSPFLNTPFMTLKHDLPDETQLGNMVSDAALTLIGVDFSAMNCGSIRRDFLLAGPIAYRDILRIYPFSNHFVIMSLTASELREFIEIEWSPYRSCLMHVGGFHYVLQRDGDKAKIVELTYPNGEPLDETKLYRVAMNNYLSSRFLSDHCPTKTEPIPVYVFDNVVDFLKHNPDMDYRNSPIRARILPRSN
jgi:2',3'-cyclic-nucleotide 2'-phosphodiesterase (5'-nucleotidase family)